MTSVSTRNIIIAYFFLISGCAGKADNVIEADLFSRFQYYTIEDWASVKHSSIEVETWYNSQKDSAVYLSQPRSIIEVSDNKFWVSDVMSGSIREFTANGNYSHQVIGRGKGPNEVIRPFALGKYESGDKNLIYVFDGDQQLYIKLDEDGNELARVNTPSISYKAMIDFPVIIDEDRLIWHTFNQDEFTLSEWDSLGNFRKGWVKRIKPMGTQPETYNSVYYDIEISSEDITYAYNGLPLVFYKMNGLNEVINLIPDDSINEIQNRLEKKPENEFNSVDAIIKGIGVDKENIFVGFKNDLFIIPSNKRKEVKKFQLKNENGENIIFHFMKKTNNYLFFIDGYNNIIYSLKYVNLI